MCLHYVSSYIMFQVTSPNVCSDTKQSVTFDISQSQACIHPLFELRRQLLGKVLKLGGRAIFHMAMLTRVAQQCTGSNETVKSGFKSLLHKKIRLMERFKHKQSPHITLSFASLSLSFTGTKIYSSNV